MMRGCMQMASEEAETRQSELALRLVETRQALEEAHEEAAASSARQQSQHREEATVLRAKLEQSQGKGTGLRRSGRVRAEGPSLGRVEQHCAAAAIKPMHGVRRWFRLMC